MKLTEEIKEVNSKFTKLIEDINKAILDLKTPIFDHYGEQGLNFPKVKFVIYVNPETDLLIRQYHFHNGTQVLKECKGQEPSMLMGCAYYVSQKNHPSFEVYVDEIIACHTTPIRSQY